MRRVADHFTRMARQQGYHARSVFKLQEADQRFRILSRGMRVVDLGAAPGSWSLYAAKRVGPTGLVLSLDLSEPTQTFPSHVVFRQQDVFEWQPGVRGWTGGSAIRMQSYL